MCADKRIGTEVALFIVGPTLLGGGPWSLCWAFGSTLGWKDSK